MNFKGLYPEFKIINAKIQNNVDYRLLVAVGDGEVSIWLNDINIDRYPVTGEIISNNEALYIGTISGLYHPFTGNIYEVKLLEFNNMQLTRELNEMKNENSKAEKVRLLIAGDSTVEDSVMSDNDRHQGWGQSIGRYFQQMVKVRNMAISGRSSKTFINEGRWDELLRQVRPGDFILVQFGHNDSHGKDLPESTNLSDYKGYLCRYADDALKARANLIFITPPHRRYFNADGTIVNDLLLYSEAMKAVAEEKKVPLVDLYALSGDLMQRLGENGCADLFWNETDRTHFSAHGAAELSKLIIGELRRQNHPLVEMMVPLSAEK